MYKKVFLVFVAVAFMAIFSVAEASAQTNVEPQITGGYSDTPVTSKEVKAAAAVAIADHNKATKDSAKLVSITKAQLQVVAGLNYRICMKIKVNGKVRRVTAVVYKDLKQKSSLSMWTPGNCSI
jgi:hypothetical protein